MIFQVPRKREERTKYILHLNGTVSYLLCLKSFSHITQSTNSSCLHHFYARKQNALRVFAIVWASVCPSVSPSVTLVICMKTVQTRITKSSLCAATRSLVYRDKISCHWVQGFPSNEGVEEGYPLKRRHFAVIGSNNVKTVVDRYIHAAYHNKHW